MLQARGFRMRARTVLSLSYGTARPFQRTEEGPSPKHMLYTYYLTLFKTALSTFYIIFVINVTYQIGFLLIYTAIVLVRKFRSG